MNDKTPTDYCMVSKYQIGDRMVSLKAKALYVALCCWSPDIDCSIKNLAEELGIGKESVSQLLKELEELGYVERNKVQGPNGTVTEYLIFPKSSFD